MSDDRDKIVEMINAVENKLRELVDDLPTIEAKIDDLSRSIEEILDRTPPGVASEFQIRGKFGNPKANFDPHGYEGPSCKGLQASECPADFCEAYAESLDYFARNPRPGQDPKFIGYNKRDAKVFRRWAIVNRGGQSATSAADSVTAERFKKSVERTFKTEDDDLPF